MGQMPNPPNPQIPLIGVSIGAARLVVSSRIPVGKMLLIRPGALAYGGLSGDRIYINPSDYVVVRLGYRPWYSRYTAGERELARDRRLRER